MMMLASLSIIYLFYLSMTGTNKADVAYGTVGQLKNENKNG